MTGGEREQLMLTYVRRYRAGESVPALAADTGQSDEFVRRLLKEAGVSLRPRGPETGPAFEPSDEFAPPAGRRDLARSPSSLAETDLPTPPLGVLVRRRDKGSANRAEKVALAKAEAGAKGRAKNGDKAGSGKAAAKKAKSKKSKK